MGADPRERVRGAGVTYRRNRKEGPAVVKKGWGVRKVMHRWDRSTARESAGLSPVICSVPNALMHTQKHTRRYIQTCRYT